MNNADSVFASGYRAGYADGAAGVNDPASSPYVRRPAREGYVGNRGLTAREGHEDEARRWADGYDAGFSEAPERYCATCGNPEGSPYAEHCCTDDNMID